MSIPSCGPYLFNVFSPTYDSQGWARTLHFACIGFGPESRTVLLCVLHISTSCLVHTPISCIVHITWTCTTLSTLAKRSVNVKHVALTWTILSIKHYACNLAIVILHHNLFFRTLPNRDLRLYSFLPPKSKNLSTIFPRCVERTFMS